MITFFISHNFFESQKYLYSAQKILFQSWFKSQNSRSWLIKTQYSNSSCNIEKLFRLHIPRKNEKNFTDILVKFCSRQEGSSRNIRYSVIHLTDKLKIKSNQKILILVQKYLYQVMKFENYWIMRYKFRKWRKKIPKFSAWYVRKKYW